MKTRYIFSVSFTDHPATPSAKRWDPHGWSGFAAQEDIEYQRQNPPKNAAPGWRIDEVVPLEDPRLADKFWLCSETLGSQMLILSTAEVLRLIAKGPNVRLHSGPHPTRGSAEECEDAWGKP